jgi:hypothetical protein
MSAPSSCPDSTALVRQIVDYFISGLLIGVEPSATFCRSPSKSSFRRRRYRRRRRATRAPRHG